MKTPEVWPLALVPIVVATAITAGLSAAAIHLLPPLVLGWIGAVPAWAEVILTAVVSALAVLAAMLAALGLAQPLSAPALERIVRRVEAAEGAPAWPATSFVVDVGRSFQSIAVSYAFGLPLLLALFLVNLVLPPAVVVTFPLKMIVVAVLLAWDLCDYPLSARGVPIADRIAFVARHKGAMLGFGVGLALLSLIPCALFLLLPAGIAGAARLVLTLERADGRRLAP